METEENKIQRVSDADAESLPSMCEIRFDCLVTMFEMGIRGSSKGIAAMFAAERPKRPQWFKIQNKITLDAIRHCDEYSLGLRLKQMLKQLEDHIEKHCNQ